jgi:hypothetical protein
MSLYRAIIAAAFISAALVSGARAFETTSIGGVNADGSAKYQEPDELGSLQTPSSSPFGNFNFSAGTTSDTGASSATPRWLNEPGSRGFGFTGSQSTSAEPASPFNTPILRDRN